MHAGILEVAAEILAVGARHPRRGVEQALAVGIVAGPAQQRADRGLGLRLRDRRVRECIGAALGVVFEKVIHAGV